MKTHLAMADAQRRLEAAGITGGSARDLRLLLARALDIPANRLTIERPEALSRDQLARFTALVARRAAREPMAHILGHRAFFGRDFRVSADVLDPRPETETLIETALEQPFTTLLDLGTGSGCILVTLLAERPEAQGTGSDLSTKALAIAQDNAQRHAVANRARFMHSDWYAGLSGRFELIVSNPPYIAAAEMAGLSAELGFEPRMALTDEGDGLACYRIIVADAGTHLTRGGWLMVEIGPEQGAAVAAMFVASGLHSVGIRSDLDGRDRVVVGQNPL